ITNQEILILHKSYFFSKEFNEKENPAEGKKLSENEEIAEACWNGLIREMLPEISTPLPLTVVNEAPAFLYLAFGEYGQQIEKKLSLNPYLFIDAEPGRWS
ncbi:MAG: hypothetical protein ABIN04_08985, partial [Ginsengibacter sp.]